jgi:hypothetical protein
MHETLGPWCRGRWTVKPKASAHQRLAQWSGGVESIQQLPAKVAQKRRPGHRSAVQKVDPGDADLNFAVAQTVIGLGQVRLAGIVAVLFNKG